MTNAQRIERLAGKEPPYDVNDLREIVAALRGEGGCPWDIEQDHKSIRRDLLEETYEVVEAIDNDDPSLMREELGDLLLQIVFHSQIEAELGRSDFDGVVNDICAKLIRRHPHVFGSVVAETSEQVLENWDAIKSEEKQRITLASKLNAVPRQLPALMRAQKIGKKTSFFDFADKDEVLAKLNEEALEVAEAIKSGNPDEVEEEVGDLLFTAVSLARHCGVDAEKALTLATDKYISRFARLETVATERGLDVTNTPQSELDAIWNEIKNRT